MSKKPTPAPPPKPDTEGPDSSPDRSDTVLTVLIFVVFLALCVIAWWLAQRQAIPGAPGAPVG